VPLFPEEDFLESVHSAGIAPGIKNKITALSTNKQTNACLLAQQQLQRLVVPQELRSVYSGVPQPGFSRISVWVPRNIRG